MKISWGWKIVALYSGFVLLMLFMVFKATSEEFHMVKEDYYGAELQHNEHMQKVRNAIELKSGMEIKHEAAELQLSIQFPANMTHIQGQAKLYRPSNSHLDVTLDLDTDLQNKQVFSTADYPKGKWILQVDWISGDQAYYVEETIVF